MTVLAYDVLKTVSYQSPRPVRLLSNTHD